MNEDLPLVERRSGLFRIFKTSDRNYNPDRPPVQGAFRARHQWTEATTVEYPRQVIENKESWWYKEGANHRYRAEDIRICRDIINVAWFIEVPDAAALLDLIKRADCRVIVEDCGYRCNHPTIEIYDDYHY